jgi:Sigma-70, region 4
MSVLGRLQELPDPCAYCGRDSHRWDRPGPLEQRLLARHFDRISQRDQQLLLLRWRRPDLTLADVAAQLGGLSRERVRQVEHGAIRRLRRAAYEAADPGARSRPRRRRL